MVTPTTTPIIEPKTTRDRELKGITSKTTTTTTKYIKDSCIIFNERQ